MKKLLSMVLCFALVIGVFAGFQAKTSGAEEIADLYTTETPKMNCIKIKWMKTRDAKKVVIYRADVTKRVKKGDFFLAKKKYKKIAKLSGSSTSFKNTKVKKNRYYAYIVDVLDKNKKIIASTYDYDYDVHVFVPKCKGVDCPRIDTYEDSSQYQTTADCIRFRVLSGYGVKTKKFVIYRKGPNDKKYKKLKGVLSKDKFSDAYKPLVCQDKNVEAGKTYKYKAKAYVKKGKKKIYSKFTKVLKITAQDSQE